MDSESEYEYVHIPHGIGAPIQPFGVLPPIETRGKEVIESGSSIQPPNQSTTNVSASIIPAPEQVNQFQPKPPSTPRQENLRGRVLKRKSFSLLTEKTFDPATQLKKLPEIARGKKHSTIGRLQRQCSNVGMNRSKGEMNVYKQLPDIKPSMSSRRIVPKTTPTKHVTPTKISSVGTDFKDQHGLERLIGGSLLKPATKQNVRKVNIAKHGVLKLTSLPDDLYASEDISGALQEELTQFKEVINRDTKAEGLVDTPAELILTFSDSSLDSNTQEIVINYENYVAENLDVTRGRSRMTNLQVTVSRLESRMLRAASRVGSRQKLRSMAKGLPERYDVDNYPQSKTKVQHRVGRVFSEVTGSDINKLSSGVFTPAPPIVTRSDRMKLNESGYDSTYALFKINGYSFNVESVSGERKKLQKRNGSKTDESDADKGYCGE